MNTLVEVILTLPDGLAREAARAGLPTSQAIEELLREALRKRAVGELVEAMDRMHAVPGPPMSEDEIQAEIDAVRAARGR